MAVMLVMASLMSMASFVNAGIVERILGEEYAEEYYELRATSTSFVSAKCDATKENIWCKNNKCILRVEWSCGGCPLHKNKEFRDCACPQ